MGVELDPRKNAASTMTFTAPHQHWVPNPASAAARYCSSSAKRARNTATYGRTAAVISPFERVERVELRDHFLDRGLLEVHVLHLEARRHLRNELVSRDGPRIERELEQPTLAPAHGRARKQDVRCIVGELHTQSPLGERAAAKRREAAVRQDAAVADHDHALGKCL